MLTKKLLIVNTTPYNVHVMFPGPVLQCTASIGNRVSWFQWYHTLSSTIPLHRSKCIKSIAGSKGSEKPLAGLIESGKTQSG